MSQKIYSYRYNSIAPYCYKNKSLQNLHSNKYNHKIHKFNIIKQKYINNNTTTFIPPNKQKKLSNNNKKHTNTLTINEINNTLNTNEINNTLNINKINNTLIINEQNINNDLVLHNKTIYYYFNNIINYFNSYFLNKNI